MKTEELFVKQAIELGSSEEELLRIACELEEVLHTRQRFDLLLFEALETIRHGLKHHPSVKK